MVGGESGVDLNQIWVRIASVELFTAATHDSLEVTALVVNLSAVCVVYYSAVD